MRSVASLPLNLAPDAGAVRWNPSDYAANSSSQQLWARELIARLELKGDEAILDVGCGDGKVTAELARAVPRGRVLGVDASTDMIGFAAKSFGSVSNLEFRVMDARTIAVESDFDLVFSNAALHWVDDHPAFLRGAASALVNGGRLVTSCGGSGNAQDVFVALRSAMRLKRWREFFRKVPKPYFFHHPDEYQEWLPRFGFRADRVELVDKDMTFTDATGFAAWIRTTWLPYTQRVPESMREEFVKVFADRYTARHPAHDAGRVHVRMVRLEIDATKTR